jgi:LytS/YehU family sensor histidine kinase
MINIRNSYFVPGLHVLVWGSLLLVPALLFREPVGGLPHNFFITSNFYHIALFYFNAYFLYPRLLNKRTWWLYLIVVVAIMAASYYVKLFLLELNGSFQLTPLNQRIIFFPPFAFLTASIIFRMASDRIRREKIEKEKKAERLATELKFLRSQVSPHFLFNMLTNMVSLARQKSDLLEPSLIKLSDLLRYMLYEPDQEKFPLSREIIYLKNYIELQQLRFGDDVNLVLEINDENPDCLIEPMLLVPFVENAFKHGIGLVTDPFIKIQLAVKANNLYFKVSNNYGREKSSKDKDSGIGLANVKNKLQLLYPGKHRLEIKDAGNIYTAELNLELSC